MCNDYEKSEGFVKDQEADKYLDEHNRFLHFYNGYFLNNKGEEATKKLKASFENKAKEYQSYTGAEPEFIFEALSDLVEVFQLEKIMVAYVFFQFRHILKYTYIYAYYQPSDSNFKHIFQVQLATAQHISESLGYELMQPVEKYNRVKIVKYNQAGKKVKMVRKNR